MIPARRHDLKVGTRERKAERGQAITYMYTYHAVSERTKKVTKDEGGDAGL